MSDLVEVFWAAPDVVLLLPQFVAAALYHSESWLEKNRQDQDPIPFVRVGGKVLYRKGDVVRWLTEQSAGVTHE